MPRDLPDAGTIPMQIGDLDPFVLRQIPRADLPDRQPLQRRHEPDDLALAVGLISAGPVVARRTGNADLPGSGMDTPPPLTQLHEPLTLGRLRTPPRPLLHTTGRHQHNPQILGSVATVARNHPLENW